MVIISLRKFRWALSGIACQDGCFTSDKGLAIVCVLGTLLTLLLVLQFSRYSALTLGILYGVRRNSKCTASLYKHCSSNVV